MQQTPQPDQTHDAIVALMRDHAPRPAHDPSELNIAPGRDEPEVTTAPSIAPPQEPAIEDAPIAPAPAAEAPAPATPEPAFEPMPKAIAVEPIALATPVEPLRATASSDIKMDAELHQPPTKHGRGFLRFVTMVFVGIAATIGWQVYGETAREKMSGLFAAAPASAEQANAAEPQAAQPVQTAAAETPPQPAAATPADTTQAQAAIPADVAQKMDSMSREIASLKQTIEQLKAGQLQMNRDLAKTMEHQVKQKSATPPAKQTSVQPPPQPQPPAQPQRASVTPPAPQQVSAAPAPQQPNYGQPQMYGQSRVYDRPPQTYGRSYDEPYVRPYAGRRYDSADADRDDVYIAPPPSPNYQPGYTTIPRPPAPMQ